jgi:hypothetical protein
LALIETLSHLSIDTAGKRLVNSPPGPPRALRRVTPEDRRSTTRIRSFTLKPVPWTATGWVPTSSSSAASRIASEAVPMPDPAVAATAARAMPVPMHLCHARCLIAARTY